MRDPTQRQACATELWAIERCSHHSVCVQEELVQSMRSEGRRQATQRIMRAKRDGQMAFALMNRLEMEGSQQRKGVRRALDLETPAPAGALHSLQLLLLPAVGTTQIHRGTFCQLSAAYAQMHGIDAGLDWPYLQASV